MMLQYIKDLSEKLNNTSNAQGIIRILEEFFYPCDVEKISIFVFDETTSTLRDFSRSWMCIDECLEKEKSKEAYQIFKKLESKKYIKNKDNTLFYPISKQDKVIGMLVFKGSSYDTILEFLDYASFSISLKIQNVILSERMQKNIDFHDSMKNIAKIIETQYETNYIIPIIGEMIDKFVSDHLIYIFLKCEKTKELKLIWPSACKDSKIFELIKCLTDNSDYILTPDKKIGIFPLVSENVLLGCIVTKSTENILSEKEIEYLEQLTTQAATTINRANVYAEILQHATLDALTGFYNRHQLEERIKQEIATSKRQSRPLCAIMTDIDYFKSVNDTYGHAVGDFVLKNVAQVIRSQLREYDIAGRYGGEEFAILLPYTEIKDAQIVAERLRKAVEKKKLDISKINSEVAQKIIGVTISLGIYQYKAEDSEEDLFKKADKALYNAKQSGRNKVLIQE